MNNAKSTGAKEAAMSEPPLVNEAEIVEPPPTNVPIYKVTQALNRLVQFREKVDILKAAFQACAACCDVENSGDDVSAKKAEFIRKSLVQAMNTAEMNSASSPAYVRMFDLTRRDVRVSLVNAWAPEKARDTKKQKLND